MELLFADASVFKKLVDGIATLVSEAEFLVDEKGLSLKPTDPSQISLVDFTLPKKAFKKFEISGNSKIGVDLNYLNQVMSRAKASDSLKLSASKDSSSLSVVFQGSAQRSFSIPLIDISQADLPVPKIDFDAIVRLKAGVLQDSFKDAALVSSHVLLAVENDSLKVKATSSKGNLENVYASKGESIISLKAQQEASAMFPLEYLSGMVKAASSDTEITLNLKSSAPAELSYSVGEGTLRYFLAPRIESE